MKDRHAAILAMAVSIASVMLFAVASDAIQPRHIFGSPMLIVLLALGLFVALPVYAVIGGWLGLRLRRFMLIGALLIPLLWLLLAFKWGENPPLNARSVSWIVGHPLVAAMTFWAVLRIALGRTSKRPPGTDPDGRL